VPRAIQEVNEQADNHPDYKTHPRVKWKACHKVQAEEYAQNGDKGNTGGPEGPVEFRLGVAQDQHSGTDYDKGK